jgi:Holliday junction DNA helicase RuvB
MQMGLIDRTPRGRVATALAYKHFGIPLPEGRTREEAGGRQPELFS